MRKSPCLVIWGRRNWGRQQATRTGWWLHGLRVGALWISPWISPMRRARETADCIASVTTTCSARTPCRQVCWMRGIPSCAVTAVDDLDSVVIASVPHLM